MYISFSPSPSLPWEKKYSLLSLIPPCPTQVMRSDRLHISCSAPASESWTDGQHQDGGAAKSGRWAWYPQVCLAAAEEQSQFSMCSAPSRAIHSGGAGNQPLCSATSAKVLASCWGRDLICRQQGGEAGSRITATHTHGAGRDPSCIFGGLGIFSSLN